MMSASLTIAFLPVYKNPYQHLLTNALHQQGVAVEHLHRSPSFVWLFRSRHRVQILHLHWLSGLYMKRLLTPLQVAIFLSKILLAQALGYKIVWTVHNILPHQLPFPSLHHFIRRFIMNRANAVIAHCEYGLNEITRLFPRHKPSYIIPIGNYASLYPITSSKEQARQVLSLHPDAFIYLFLGNITPYKGVDRLLETFHAHATPTDIVLIVGRNRSPTFVQRLQTLAEQDPRVHINASYVPDDEIQNYLLAADVMVLPFNDILTSSSVITGMSYALPIIAPALGCLPELVTPDAGILYDPQDPEGLRNSMQRIKNLNTAHMGQVAKKITQSLSWDNIAQQTARVYRDCLQ
ncbi:MAG: glycosyltransferase family 4 protein [Anaerolineales bacterium]|nr:glycosyltransferase family 4 protein [Anaerolineales bacterium]